MFLVLCKRKLKQVNQMINTQISLNNPDIVLNTPSNVSSLVYGNKEQGDTQPSDYQCDNLRI